MAKKIIGYSKLIWTCPNCQTENPGPEKVCRGCGAPQPADVNFHQSTQQQLLKDEEEIKLAKAGADIHCGFCGTRNPAAATVCSQCGSDLSAGSRRVVGTIIGAFQNDPTVGNWQCSHCNHQNLSIHSHCVQCGAPRVQTTPVTVSESAVTPAKPKKKWLIPAIIGAILIVILFILIFTLSQKQELTGYVAGTNWQRSIQIESFGPVQKEDWKDSIPAAATLGSCDYRYRRDQDQPAPQSTEVCGTPYTVDLGNGNAEIVQDCTYRVYEQFCDYTIEDWYDSGEISLQGADLNPHWPAQDLRQNQRIGDQQEVYTIIFQTNDGDYEYRISNESEFKEFIPGSRWVLTINAFNNVTDVMPVD